MVRGIMVALVVGLVATQAALWIVASGQGQRLERLERACGPVSTGGGVSQCANPSVSDLAIAACLRNDAYSRNLLGQCLDDWHESRTP